MGYFSNGTEGMRYEEQWCDRCIHGQDEDNPCVVWGVHLMFNYEETNNSKSILDELIPRRGGENQQCRMFVQRPAPKFLEGQKELSRPGTTGAQQKG